jgi:hypothetical protein
MENKEEPVVEFGKGHGLAIAAVIAGAAIAIGVPAVVLGLGHALTSTMQFWLTVSAVSAGGLTTLTAAFFGTTMPSSVGGYHYHKHCAERQADDLKRPEGDLKTLEKEGGN